MCTDYLGISKIRLPTRKECLDFYKEIGTPENIIRHAFAVNKVAVFLAEQLKMKGIDINVELVDRASFLHDLDKWLVINNQNLKHGFETERILAEKGFPEVGVAARQHVIIDGHGSWEEKVIAYADRRVMGVEIVPLQERINYILHKYNGGNPHIRERKERAFRRLEDELFSYLDFSPDELETKMKYSRNKLR